MKVLNLRSALGAMLVASIAWSFAACSGESDGGDPSGIGGDGSTSDGSSDATATDAPPGSDSGHADGEAPRDGGTDDGSTGDGGAPSACATLYSDAAFCDDFDIGQRKPGWVVLGTSPTVVGAGSPSVSPPHALRSETASMPDASAQSRIARDVPAGSAEWRLEANVRVTTVGPSVGTPQWPVLLHLLLPDRTGLFVLQLTPRQTVACAGLGASVGGEMAFAHGAWHKVTMTMTRSGSNVDLSCQVDALPVQTAPAAIDGGVALGSPADVRIGVFAFRGQGALDVLYDDVVFRTR